MFGPEDGSEMVGGYEVPIDPMELAGGYCESCQ
jgi:hypothetical protein